MKLFLFVFILFLLGSSTLKAQMVDDATPTNAFPILNTPLQGAWQLDFSDEFASQTLDLNKWSVDVSAKSRASRAGLGINDWWWKADNVWVEQDNLVLRVDKHDYNTMYCGSVNSNDKYETKYGYFEARIKIADASKGTHTAFWLQGDNMNNVDGTANDGAEIDIFESAWLEDYTKAVIHIDGYGVNHQANTKRYDTPGIHSGYHVFGMHWTKDFIKIYYDGELKATYSDPKWVVQVPEYLWLSDGASFGYSGDNFTSEPNGTLTHAYVDYVRVWKAVPTDGNELECEALSNTTSASSIAELKTHSLASNGQHIRLAGDDNNNEIVFQLPIAEKGDHTITLQSLTWVDFGQYTCYIETRPGNWQLISDIFDLYSGDGKVVVNTFNEIYLEEGTYHVKMVCIGKNDAASNYYGSFDKFIVETRNVQTSTADNFIGKSSKEFFPNPVRDFLFVSGGSLNESVIIFDLSGVAVLSLTGTDKINVSSLKEGLYILRMANQVFKFQKI